MIEDEAKAAAAETKRGVFIDGNPFSHVEDAWSDGYTEGFIAHASRPTGETHDEDTLRKVYDALERAGMGYGDARETATVLQNAGILFRERAPEPAPDSHELSNAESSDETATSLDVDMEHAPQDAEPPQSFGVQSQTDTRHPQPTEGEPSDALEAMTAEKDERRKRCAEETIAWTEATKRADVAESRWRAAEDECRAVQSRLDAALTDQGKPQISEDMVERGAKALWVAQQGDREWAARAVDDLFSPADDWPEEAMDMAEYARAVLEAALGGEA